MHIRFNRNILGCKEVQKKRAGTDVGRFNRNILGCKGLIINGDINPNKI